VGNAVALAFYALILGGAALVVWRNPVAALYAFVVGLALHNAAMAALYGLGIRGGALTAIQAWKEILLVVAFARVARDSLSVRRLPFRPGPVDVLALAFAALVVLYALLPQSALGGSAGTKAVLYALRHDLVAVGAFLLGRSLALGRTELRRLAWTLVAAAAAVSAAGLVEEYTVSLDWWGRSGAVGYFHRQLGFDYHGPRRLPENFVYNTGDENRLLRRLVSSFLSPLATASMLVVALLVAAAAPLRRRVAVALAAVSAVGLLFTFSRSSLLALAAGLCVLALVRRRLWPLLAAVATVAAAVAFVHVFPSIAPRDHWSRPDLVYQRREARRLGGVRGGALSASEPSLHSHWVSLREGVRTVARHPQGFGLGNAGEIASRNGITPKAGESTYTELGVEAGLLGMLVFVAWSLTLLAGLVASAHREGEWAAAGVAAAFSAVLLVAVQTDVLGDPWLAYCVWFLGGSLLTLAARPSVEDEPRTPAGRSAADPRPGSRSGASRDRRSAAESRIVTG
jgi:hypothetical protein